MLSSTEIHSLISLLDDEDEEVVAHVKDKLISLGAEVVNQLLASKLHFSNTTQLNRIEEVIQTIRIKALLHDLNNWYNNSTHDLLEAVCLVASYQYPQLNQQQIINQLDKIRLDIWLEMHYDLSPYEKVRIINHAMYNLYGFKGNTDNYHAPENSFINVVLDTRKGNPIMLSVVYILLAQRLHLPIFGINLPQHFVCAYKEETSPTQQNDPFNLAEKIDHKQGRVLFYINAFNSGAVFTKANLEQFLLQLKIQSQPGFFEPCSNVDIVKRILRNLVVAYEKSNQVEHANNIKSLLLVLGEDYFSYNEEQPF